MQTVTDTGFMSTCPDNIHNSTFHYLTCPRCRQIREEAAGGNAHGPDVTAEEYVLSELQRWGIGAILLNTGGGQLVVEAHYTIGSVAWFKGRTLCNYPIEIMTDTATQPTKVTEFKSDFEIASWIQEHRFAFVPEDVVM